MEDRKEKLKQFAVDAPLLIEAGFIAIKQVDEKNAKRCFYAAMVADPEQSLAVVGLGIVALFKLELDEAKEMFRAVLEKEPENEMAKTMLGITHLYSITDEGLKEGKKLIEESMDHCKESDVQNLGHESLELMKEIKKKMRDLHPLEASKGKGHPKTRLKK